MAYDPNLDKQLFKVEKEFDTTKLIVSIMSYNDGQPKLQISRNNYNEDHWTFSKLGRLNKEEATALNEMIEKALQHF